MMISGATGAGLGLAGADTQDSKPFEGSPASRLHKHEDDENAAAGAAGQVIAMLTKGFFSETRASAADPDGAGGAYTLGPASEVSGLVFMVTSNLGYESV